MFREIGIGLVMNGLKLINLQWFFEGQVQDKWCRCGTIKSENTQEVWHPLQYIKFS